MSAPEPSSISIEAIRKRVALHYGLTHEELRAHTHARRVAWPRQMAMYLARRLTPHSLPKIALLLGAADHTSVHYGIGQVEKRIASDPAWRGAAETIERLIREDLAAPKQWHCRGCGTAHAMAVMRCSCTPRRPNQCATLTDSTVAVAQGKTS